MSREDESTVDERASLDGPTVTPATRSGSAFDPPGRRFVEQSELGRGGMGRVVEAYDRALDRAVAIKHLLDVDDTSLARFEREVRITARLQHPGIGPILDAGRGEDGRPFYIMRKIDGEPLDTRVRAARDVRERLALVPDLLRAVDAAAYAHAQGVVHRDIKPSNILLGRFGETLLIDWGIARDLERPDDFSYMTDDGAARDSNKLTRLGSAIGTPGFMAPEQARGEPAGRRADVYSLGATLYYVLSGVVPFDKSDGTAAIKEAAAGRTPDLAVIPEEVPVELVAIAKQALAAEPDARYSDAGALAADLRRFLAGQLVAAHRYSPQQRLGRWIRRHRIAVAIASIAVVTIAVVTVLAFRSVVAQRDQARAMTALAEARAEDTLLERSRALLSVDPTSAVALLRPLPANSTHWAEAREIVAAAVASGVDRGVRLGDRSVTVGVSDAGQVVTVGFDTTTVFDSDLRVLKQFPAPKYAIGELVPFDAHTFVFRSPSTGITDTVGLLDIDTGEAKPLAIDAVSELAVGNGRLALADQRGQLTWYPAAPPNLPMWVNDGVRQLDARNGRILLVGYDHVLVIDSDNRIRSRDFSLDGVATDARLSPDGMRAAMLFTVPNGPDIVELALDGSPPKRWPRTRGEWRSIEYVGDRLYSWIRGEGLVALDTDLPAWRWTVRAPRASFAAFDGGGIFVTPDGAIAIVDRAGVIPLPRRRIDEPQIAIDRGGHVAYLGTGVGELIAVDLRPVRARIVEPSTLEPMPEIQAVLSGKTIYADGLATAPLAVSPTHLVYHARPTEEVILVDLRTGATHKLLGDTSSPNAFLEAGTAWACVRDACTTFDLEGRELQHIDQVHSWSFGLLFGVETVAVEKANGEVFVQPADASVPAHLLDGVPKQVTNAIGVPIPLLFDFTNAGLVITRYPSQHWLFDKTGPHELPTGLTGFTRPHGTTPDGTWWIIKDNTSLYRLPVGGAPEPVALDANVNEVWLSGSRVQAVGDDVVFELDLAGTVLRKSAIPRARVTALTANKMVLDTTEGPVVVSLGANVHRNHRLAVDSGMMKSSHDGRVIAVTTQLPHNPIAIWSDPVPLDPAAVPAYLHQITNAKLSIGSDAVSWDER